MIQVYNNKIAAYQKLNEIIASYIIDLSQSDKYEKEIICIQENTMEAINLSYVIKANERYMRTYNLMILGKENERPAPVKIEAVEVYKYFDLKEKEFSKEIRAREIIISELMRQISAMTDRQAIDAKIKIYYLKRNIEAKKLYKKFFDQRKMAT